MGKNIQLASGRMRSSAICVRKQLICFHSFQLIRRIVGPNSDDSDQHLRKRILICYLCVKRRMVPFSIAFKSGFYSIFMCRSVSKKSSFCLNARVRNMPEVC